MIKNNGDKRGLHGCCPDANTTFITTCVGNAACLRGSDSKVMVGTTASHGCLFNVVPCCLFAVPSMLYVFLAFGSPSWCVLQ